ncbi:DUF6930 domain-containing protein [Gloeobacter kilaueensis]|uniref:Uncharacterized protein n=1 Tax=Gloeobacter kilaueensis (strain ATCC BAA-2537 / CCAP 1431/1 / ULC 316 / JS1) TaxID=1183438 RepID=U5QKL2_GLOK1|nr:hypothetical protein [Gloeobacter kilaueensis]AGY58159.1 hypothetical protein GKIL_1913 [Gloeobacter kilaueensis JS1]
MSTLNPSTLRRLQRLPQLSAAWEGDRRVLATVSIADQEQPPELIVWADAAEGTVRATELVAPEVGNEAIVRCLLQAIEQPHSQFPPGRPEKVVVRDRQVQLFLRGALQELNIVVEYAPQLPLLDDVYESLQKFISNRQPQLPPLYRQPLLRLARALWQEAPWRYLADHQVLRVEIEDWEPAALHISLLGLLGQEYGVLMYRSIDSLRRFREQLSHDRTPQQRQEAYLQQDCLFMTYEQAGAEEDDGPTDLADLPASEVEPSFGQLHPLEGARPFLGEEEAQTVMLTLEALQRFFRLRHRELGLESFPAISGRYRIDLGPSRKVTVRVSTQPQLADELSQLVAIRPPVADPFEDDGPPLSDDLLPEGAIYSIGMLPWEVVELLLAARQQQPAPSRRERSDGLPTILVQTSRPKARGLIAELDRAGGPTGFGFNPGQDLLTRTRYDLAVLRTGNGQLHLFGEFELDDPHHVKARRQWNERCRKSGGRCGLVIAQGVTGSGRGNPELKDMLALFELQTLSIDDLGLGVLNLMPDFG